MLIIPAFGRLRQENCELEPSLNYILRLCLKKKKKKRKKKKQKGET
jgi:hypothetical protein